MLDEDYTTCVGTIIVATEVEEVHQSLKNNAYIFSWTTSDMSGIRPNIITHKLLVYKEARPIAQKKRKLGEDKRLPAKEEVENLLSIRFIWEAWYTTWVANIVMVTKANGKWRMCVRYTNLNNTCPKDSYPLPSIDKLVDGVTEHKILNFLDAYFSYN